MIIIRLQRRGRKNDPSFRVVVVESKRKPKAGNYLEMVGSYDPRIDRIELNAERIKHWIGNGAQVSDTVHNLLISQKIIEGKKRNVLPKKTVAKAPEPAAQAEAPASEPAPIEEPTPEEPAPAEEAGETEAPAESNSQEEVPAAE